MSSIQKLTKGSKSFLDLSHLLQYVICIRITFQRNLPKIWEYRLWRCSIIMRILSLAWLNMDWMRRLLELALTEQDWEMMEISGVESFLFVTWQTMSDILISTMSLCPEVIKLRKNPGEQPFPICINIWVRSF